MALLPPRPPRQPAPVKTDLELESTDDLLFEVCKRFDWAVFIGEVDQSPVDRRWGYTMRTKGGDEACIVLCERAASVITKYGSSNRQ